MAAGRPQQIICGTTVGHSCPAAQVAFGLNRVGKAVQSDFPRVHAKFGWLSLDPCCILTSQHALSLLQTKHGTNDGGREK